MLNSLFTGIFDTGITQVVPVTDFLLCVGCSLLMGLIFAGGYLWQNRCSKSFVITLALLPAVVCVVIMMVNGNVGTGLAVAGAFSLVRFRSAPGSAREISAIFLCMGAGLMAGMGYLGFALLFTVLMSLITLVFNRLDLGVSKRNARFRTLHITIPEDLDYTEVFTDLLQEYASQWELTRVKTTNLGSMFRLTYQITLRDPAAEKQLIDRLRCRNGNLEISVSSQETGVAEL